MFSVSKLLRCASFNHTLSGKANSIRSTFSVASPYRTACSAPSAQPSSKQPSLEDVLHMLRKDCHEDVPPRKQQHESTKEQRPKKNATATATEDPTGVKSDQTENAENPSPPRDPSEKMHDPAFLDEMLRSMADQFTASTARYAKDEGKSTLLLHFATCLRLYFFPNCKDVPAELRERVQTLGMMEGRDFSPAIVTVLSIQLLPDFLFTGEGKGYRYKQHRTKYELSLLAMACRRQSEFLHLLANPHPTELTFDGPMHSIPLSYPIWFELPMRFLDDDGKKQAITVFPFGDVMLLPLFTFRKENELEEGEEGFPPVPVEKFDIGSYRAVLPVYCYLKKEDIPVASMDPVKKTAETKPTFLLGEMSLLRSTRE